MAQIQLFYQTPLPQLRNKVLLKKFLTKTSKQYKRPIDSLNIIFCDDPYLLSINKQFLNHDFYTDIITFDLAAHPSDPIQAEIYISIQRVKENATTLNIPFTKELHRVIFHGLLHLLGYRDKLKKDQLTMRSMEDKLLLLYFGAKKKSTSK
jgi:probable rRNA maturation factor